MPDADSPRDLAPLLVPRPAEMELKRGRVRTPRGLGEVVASLLSRRWLGRSAENAHPALALLTGMPTGAAEAYQLVIEAPAERGGYPVTVSAQGEAGLRHGLRTLAQILRQYGDRLPTLSIHDQPAFAARGLMLDVSRNKVPTLEQLRAVVDLLASLKFNHLQLYTEHTFAYAGHEEVWADASPLTPGEVEELDLYARARGIELAANQNCFGHLAVWLRRPRYQHLAEIEGDDAWRFMQWERRGPFSLCPILPESEAFVRDLLGQLLPRFRSPLVNIGCDETFDVGHGRSRGEVERRAAAEFGGDFDKARASLFFDFVEKIGAIARSHGKRPMMWADIAVHHPEMLSRLAGDTIGLAWGYEPDARFAEECAHLRGHGLSAWVCPGTSTWRSITGRTTESRSNMLAAAACAGAANVGGFLICDWGDVGHTQQWPLSMQRLADAAEAAWNGTGARLDEAHARAASLQVFGDRSLALGPWIDRLGDLDLPLRTAAKVRNATAIFNDLFPPVPPKAGHRSITAPLEMWLDLRARLDGLAADRPASGENLIDAELAHTLAMAGFAIDHAAACRRSPDGLSPPGTERPALRETAGACLAELRRLWTIRNRPGGLEQACLHLERVIAGLA